MTIKDIAKMAGVSISTVSKIVNNKDVNIHPETRNRVLKIVKEYNYTPYGTVKNMSSAKTFILGVLLKNMADNPGLAEGIVHAAQEKGYCVLFMDSQNHPEDELKHITALCHRKVDGILWEPLCPQSAAYKQHFLQAQIPVCIFNSPMASDSLKIDLQHIGYLCTKELLLRRHTKLSCLIRTQDPMSQSFLDGFKACLFDYQMTFHDAMIEYMPENGQMPQLPANPCTGFVCCHWSDALLLYQRLCRLGYRIPGDMSIITAAAASQAGPVSAYILPFYALGKEACFRLIKQCEQHENAKDAPPAKLPYTLTGEISLDLAPSRGRQKFLILGSINADITFVVDSPIQTGKSSVITDSTSIAGGKGPNQAVASARLGHEAVLLGKVGNDREAGLIFDILEKEKLPSNGISRDFDTPTGKAYIYIQQDGEGVTTYLPGANLTLSAIDIRSHAQLFGDCSYCLLSTDVPTEAVIQAAVTAKEFSVKTILKPSAMNVLPEILYSKTDIFIPNASEAAIFCPTEHDIKAQARFFFEKGIPVVIITMGHKGCYVHTDQLSKYIPAPQFHAVDTTGGADAFIAALACYLSDGYPLEKAISIAQYAAGFCVCGQGVTPSLVDRKTLHDYIEQHAPDLLLF